jgi:hypothetical protein
MKSDVTLIRNYGDVSDNRLLARAAQYRATTAREWSSRQNVTELLNGVLSRQVARKQLPVGRMWMHTNSALIFP